MLLASTAMAAVHLCDWRDLALSISHCDALITDAPYSARTHSGHDVAVENDADRRSISYAAWSPADVAAFVSTWSPRTDGWIVSITDHGLQEAWCDALASDGRYVFSPLPYVAPGSRVRLTGDGPSCWHCWIVVARPKTRAMQKWGTLPGAYVLPPGEGGSMPVVGGKPIWLMRQLAADYSRPGDLICDPCCGAGSTLVGALREGRRAIGGDINPEHAAMAAKWITEAWAKTPALAHRQPALFEATP